MVQGGVCADLWGSDEQDCWPLLPSGWFYGCQRAVAGVAGGRCGFSMCPLRLEEVGGVATGVDIGARKNPVVRRHL